MKWLHICLNAGLVFSLLSACSGPSGSQPTPPPLPQVEEASKILFTVERGSITAERIVAGEIVPARQNELFFRTSGYISQVYFKSGETIKKGDVLADLRMDDLVEQLQQATIDLEIARQNVAIQEAQKAYDIQQAESNAVIAQKQVEQARRALSNASAAQSADAQANLDIAVERYKTAQSYLNLVKAKQDTDLAQGLRRSELAVDRINRQVRERQLIAPYDGIVMYISLIPGTQAQAFARMALVGDPASLVVQVGYDYELLTTVDPRTPTFMYTTKEKTPKFPVQFVQNFMPLSNKVEGITQNGSDITVNYLYFTIPADIPRSQTPVGSRVDIQVILGDKQDVLLLSPAAIRGNDAFSYVIVLEDSTHRRVEIVNIGVKTADKWEVDANLKPGDQVLGP